MEGKFFSRHLLPPGQLTIDNFRNSARDKDVTVLTEDACSNCPICTT